MLLAFEKGNVCQHNMLSYVITILIPFLVFLLALSGGTDNTAPALTHKLFLLTKPNFLSL